MAINGISFQNLIPAASGSPLTAGTAQSSSADEFGSMIKNAVESIDKTEKSAEQEISRAVTGESTDLHKTIIQLQTADMKFQLGLQVRNKLIGAYEEIMRMQV